MKTLEVRKDYINVYNIDVVVIDRVGDLLNRGFERGKYKNHLGCSITSNWSEATKEEVIEAFIKHLPHRFGKDWRTMKIKERHPDSVLTINDGTWEVEISKEHDGWNVWNRNGLLYCDGIWVERLEEKKIHIKEAIKEKTVIHCETEEEANRILEMAHELGHKWCTREGYKNNTLWRDYREKTCYNIFDGIFGYVKFYEGYKQIIPSTQIADLDPEESTDWTTPPEDIEAMKSDKEIDKCSQLKRDILTILSVESKLNPDKKISEYLEQFKLTLEVL